MTPCGIILYICVRLQGCNGLESHPATPLQVFKDYKFSTRDGYGAEADKIIQMAQNLAAHEAFLTQIGAWQWYQKAITAANQVRQALGERAFTMGQTVNGEMKTARTATDQAIADLYRTIEAMNELMPSAELTTLITQLKGIELYAKQYYLNIGKGTGTNANGGDSGDDPGNPGNPGDSGDSGNSGNSGDSGNSGAPGDTPGDSGTIIDGADEG